MPGGTLAAPSGTFFAPGLRARPTVRPGALFFTALAARTGAADFLAAGRFAAGFFAAGLAVPPRFGAACPARVCVASAVLSPRPSSGRSAVPCAATGSGSAATASGSPPTSTMDPAPSSPGSRSAWTDRMAATTSEASVGRGRVTSGWTSAWTMPPSSGLRLAQTMGMQRVFAVSRSWCPVWRPIEGFLSPSMTTQSMPRSFAVRQARSPVVSSSSTV